MNGQGWPRYDSRVKEPSQRGYCWISGSRALPDWLLLGSRREWPTARNVTKKQLPLVWWLTNRYSWSPLLNVATPLSHGSEWPCPLALWHLGVRRCPLATSWGHRKMGDPATLTSTPTASIKGRKMHWAIRIRSWLPSSLSSSGRSLGGRLRKCLQISGLNLRLPCAGEREVFTFVAADPATKASLNQQWSRIGPGKEPTSKWVGLRCSRKCWRPRRGFQANWKIRRWRFGLWRVSNPH